MSYADANSREAVAAQCAVLDKLVDGVIRGYRLGEGSDAFPWALDVTLSDGEDVVVMLDVAPGSVTSALPGTITISAPELDDVDDPD